MLCCTECGSTDIRHEIYEYDDGTSDDFGMYCNKCDSYIEWT